MTLAELKSALDEVYEERRLLIDERDRAKEKFTHSGGSIRLSDEEWDSLNKKIFECNKQADALRKQIKARNSHEKERYFDDKKKQRSYYHGR